MKRLFLVLLVIFLSVNVQADDGEVPPRKQLDITKKMEDVLRKDPANRIGHIPVHVSDGKTLDIVMFFTDRFSDSIIFFAQVPESKSEEEYFIKMTMIYKFFLINYKIGNMHKKNAIFLLANDIENYPYYHKISINNLKLLNNRDFGAKDLVKFDENEDMVYPIKVILRKGIFIGHNTSKADESVRGKYSSFLENYDISSLIEPMVEAFYANKKIKK